MAKRKIIKKSERHKRSMSNKKNIRRNKRTKQNKRTRGNKRTRQNKRTRRNKLKRKIHRGGAMRPGLGSETDDLKEWLTKIIMIPESRVSEMLSNLSTSIDEWTEAAQMDSYKGPLNEDFIKFLGKKNDGKKWQNLTDLISFVKSDLKLTSAEELRFRAGIRVMLRRDPESALHSSREWEAFFKKHDLPDCISIITTDYGSPAEGNIVSDWKDKRRTLWRQMPLLKGPDERMTWLSSIGLVRVRGPLSNLVVRRDGDIPVPRRTGDIPVTRRPLAHKKGDTGWVSGPRQ